MKNSYMVIPFKTYLKQLLPTLRQLSKTESFLLEGDIGRTFSKLVSRIVADGHNFQKSLQKCHPVNKKWYVYFRAHLRLVLFR